MPGLYHKYNLQKTNGEPLDPQSEYFVLRLDDGGDPEHVAACRKAIKVYADSIKNYLPELYKDLKDRYFPPTQLELDVKSGKVKWCEICLNMTKRGEDGECIEHDHKVEHWIF